MHVTKCVVYNKVYIILPRYNCSVFLELNTSHALTVHTYITADVGRHYAKVGLDHNANIMRNLQEKKVLVSLNVEKSKRIPCSDGSYFVSYFNECTEEQYGAPFYYLLAKCDITLKAR